MGVMRDIDPALESMLLALLVGSALTAIFHIEYAWWALPACTFPCVFDVNWFKNWRKKKNVG
jgi:hypothetical protein